jgi:hypothetical protein
MSIFTGKLVLLHYLEIFIALYHSIAAALGHWHEKRVEMSAAMRFGISY